MVIAVDSLCRSDHELYAERGIWKHRTYIGYDFDLTLPERKYIARSVAGAFGEFLGQHIEIVAAGSCVVTPELIESEHNVWAFGGSGPYNGAVPMETPLGPEWALTFVMDAAQGRAGQTWLIGALDEADTEKVTDKNRRYTDMVNAQLALNVSWAFKLGEIKDHFMVRQRVGSEWYWTPCTGVSIGQSSFMANAAKFAKYRAGGGHDVQKRVIELARRGRQILAYRADFIALGTDFQPTAWLGETAQFMEECAQCAGDTAMWSKNPNGIFTPCTAPIVMQARFGVDSTFMFNNCVTVAKVDCAVSVPGLIEGQSVELTKKVRTDQQKVLATETFIAFDNTEYIHNNEAKTLEAPMLEYLTFVENLYNADYLNPVNNNAPGFETGVPIERFTGRGK